VDHPAGGPRHRAGPGVLGRILVVALALDVALAWVVFQARLLFVQVVWFALSGRLLGGAEPSTVGRQLVLLVTAQRLTWLATAVLFLAWVLRAHRHLRVAGIGRVAGARDVLRAFLTPGPNLLRAPRAIGRLWRASAPAGPPRAVERWVGWWWGVCVASVAVDVGAALLGRGFRGLIGLEGGLGLLALGEGLRIAAAVLTLVIVGRIDRSQRELLGARVPAAEPPR
jgi:hypothetical protein